MDAASNTHPSCAAPYRRRRPEQIPLYQVVQEHLETWLARRSEESFGEDAVAAYVERDFRRYLECGILTHGFARARCGECRHDFLIAFTGALPPGAPAYRPSLDISCKGRGVCPSCNARRMAEVAAHLTDHVFPRQPVRQWVLSMPKKLRYHLERGRSRHPGSRDISTSLYVTRS